ncbi:citrate synthase [Sphingomonas sp. SFZ2018-12]|uniref:citrate synthase n=1 Tax=Sphingomonas sp. SFZ2018-12 TaxID=2683197 RepID=UPI001F10CD40|nr:citrate synthase [Sphingomonas sp. SFZ2018-12]MCH4893941.1 citrate synthase [Sphingomonas sp. SFZ2018-12]
MTEWIDRDTALKRLRIKAQTLYAYASRGRIRMRPDPADARRSLYSVDDVAEAGVRKARGRKPAAIASSSMAWGEPSIPTRLSTIHRGKLYYRDVDALTLASTAMLEEVARQLWAVDWQPAFSAAAGPHADAFSFLAARISTGASTIGRSGDHLAREAAQIIGGLASICGAADVPGPLHHRLARGWNGDDGTADRLRRALVAMADHDLNASTFAARVAASTGASLPACLLAALCTLSGPRHGGAGAALAALVEEARRSGAEHAVRHWRERDAMLPGFGHPLYPQGDPRAALMLAGLTPPEDLAELAANVCEQTGALPNCDYALAAITRVLRLPADAPFKIFLLGRAVGWCAHVIEQSRDGTLIRPRGRFDGALPD